MILVGMHSDDGQPVYAVRSPFGPYIQWGDATSENSEPRGCWLPKGYPIERLTIEVAMEYLRLPRVLGVYPETGTEVRVLMQECGPCLRSEIQIGNTTRHFVTQLEAEDDILTIDLKRAIDIINRHAAKYRRSEN